MRRLVVASLLCLLSLPLRADTDGSVPDATPSDAGDAPDAACVDLDALGECQGVILRSCVDGAVEEIDCAVVYGPGFTCRLTDGLFAAQCVHEAADAGLADVDASLGDAGQPAVNPEPPSGSTCIRLTPGDAGLVLGGAWMLRLRRRRGGSPQGT